MGDEETIKVFADFGVDLRKLKFTYTPNAPWWKDMVINQPLPEKDLQEGDGKDSKEEMKTCEVKKEAVQETEGLGYDDDPRNMLVTEMEEGHHQVWSLSRFEVSCQLLRNDLNQVSSTSLLMTALTNEGLSKLGALH